MISATLFPSVSVVVIVGAECPELALLHRLSDELAKLFRDLEFVIVANDVGPEISLQLKRLSEVLPDSLVLFLGEEVHEDLARLVGIDHAVCDYVLFATPTAGQIESVALIEQPLRAGCDLVVGSSPPVTNRGLFERLLFHVFRRLLKWTTGIVFDHEPVQFRVLSRSAALYLATRTQGEALVRARSIGAGFPAANFRLPEERGARSRDRTSLRRVARGARFIATGSTMLLRLNSYLALLGGIASALYGLYIAGVYLILPEVERGWTTLSLQICGMMFIFSLQFLFLSEHVLQMAGAGHVGSRRHYVIRELRGSLSRRSGRLNVVDEEGRFQLGAPVERSAAD